MLGESTNEPSASRISVNSTTPLGTTYRPPPKDYATAFAALQTTYGVPGIGSGSTAVGSTFTKPQSAATRSEVSKKASGAASAIQPVDISTENNAPSERTCTVKAVIQRITKALSLALQKIFGTGDR
ncbi:hypothetical protein MSAN_01333600 [Mycena sanguinolenta]|uniref:Uncharacterized protein n=1 Tax=Mycena sanguinolenta TaxID=230812 RepID=A0A8H6YET5_9AGAR|nr:hypothetical protein MSAN_01333600 [Mycena sanguinolenta]